jgi:hypothetical protein
MSAANANVFGPLASNLVELDEVAEHDTRRRMSDHRERSLFLDERVSTSTRVFSRFPFRFHHMDPMPEDSAAVVNPLLEIDMTGIRVAVQLKKQRVSTSFADVFIVSRALSNHHVMMPAEKA